MERDFETLLKELAECTDNPIAAKVNKAEELEVSKALSEVVGLAQFLKATMAADMRRYFSATPDEQKQIKGAFARTAYLLSLCVPKENLSIVKNSLTGPRKSKDELQ